eukprot:scaffold248986_cov30-Tisochrysis_lutea.AAC.2
MSAPGFDVRVIRCLRVGCANADVSGTYEDTSKRKRRHVTLVGRRSVARTRLKACGQGWRCLDQHVPCSRVVDLDIDGSIPPGPTKSFNTARCGRDSNSPCGLLDGKHDCPVGWRHRCERSDRGDEVGIQ